MKHAMRMMIAVALLLPTASEARGSSRRSSANTYNASEDFGKHFDEEVKYEREHASDDDGNPAPKKRKSSRRKKKAPAANSEDSF